MINSRLLLAAMIAAATSAGAQAVAERQGVWAQTYVGRAADPSVTFGRLENGMRYAIRRNNTPPGQMSVRMLIGSGSLAEHDNQQGLAHFIEHMAFRGSTHVADGDMMRILARKGLALGADTNASTSQEATIYQFDFPTSDAASIDTALMLMREVGSELTFGQAALDAERGVVLSEERVRDNPPMRANLSLLDFALAGQLAPKRWPIGKTEVIAHAPAALLRQYYEANYRPDNATLVIVGDIDPAAVEALVKSRFSDWKRPATPMTPLDLGKVAKRGEQVRLFNETGAPQSIQLSWVRPPDTEADTIAHQREQLLQYFAEKIINRRLQNMAQQGSAPFLNARLNRSDLIKSADVSTLTIVTPPDKWQPGLAAGVDQIRQAARDGVSQAELDYVLAQFGTTLANLAARATTQESPTIADGLVESASENSVYTSPAQDLAEFKTLVKTISLRDVDNTVRQTFTGSGPLLFLSSPRPVAGGEAAARAAFVAANKAPIGKYVATALAAWPYKTWGTPGTVTERKTNAAIDATSIRFANGTRLTVKPTAFGKNEVLVNVRFGYGRVGLPAGLARSYWMVSSGAPTFIQAATRKLSQTDLNQLLNARVVSARLDIDDTSFNLAGATTPEDFDTELQLLTAYVADPGYRADAISRTKAQITNWLPQVEADPGLVLERSQGLLLHSGDKRWSSLPTADEIAASQPGDLQAIVQPAIDAGAPDITIVGDIGVDAAIKAVAATLGSLPPRAPINLPSADIRFPPAPAQPVVLAHTGRPDQAIALQAWPTTGFWTNKADSRAAMVTTSVIRTRLFDQLREIDGATYSPNVDNDVSTDFAAYGAISAQVEIPPAKINAFYARLDAIVKDLSATPVPADELARAKQPMLDGRKRNLQTNAYWVAALANIARDPRDIELITDRVSAIQAVTAADVQRVATTYLYARPAYKLVVKKPD